MPNIINKLNSLAQAVDEASLAYVCTKNREFEKAHGRTRRAYSHSFGCSQNVADGEKLNCLLREMGYDLTDRQEDADLILFNTCAVRENAEDRVFGHVGALKKQKRENPDLMIILCGCMTQRAEVSEKLKTSYPYVDIVFGAGGMHRLPGLIAERFRAGTRVYSDAPADGIVEGIGQVRTDPVKANITIMQGCNNFCTYCIVPYVRGREVSRRPEDVLAEAESLLSQGYREITLLGQNVNSYGKNLPEPISFSELLRRVDAIPGDYRIRFMTSHPKDCTRELIDTIAGGTHICHHIHLPVQSGSDRLLQEMNRHYDTAHYLGLIDYARTRIPDVTFSSDIIVGFPGETREDFDATMALIKRVRYNALFTFLYSKRSGTPAATMPDPTPESEKSARFRELLSVQTEICTELNHEFLGRTVRVLIDGQGKGPGILTGRTQGNIIVEVPGDSNLIGQFANVRITRAMNWAVAGEIINNQ